MTTRRTGMNPWVLFGFLPFVFSSSALGQLRVESGCNLNEIDDRCDLDCTSMYCDTIPQPECGMSQDCPDPATGLPDGIPDECETNPPQPRTVYRVDADVAIGTNNGETWGTAFKDLKPALDTICGNMPCGIVEVWVADV